MLTRIFFGRQLVALPLVLSAFAALTACSPSSSGENAADGAAGSVTSTLPSLLVGAYTSAPEQAAISASEGLYRVDPLDGGFAEPVLLAALDNPSFAALDETTGRVYVVSEVEDGQVLGYQWSSESQALELINQASSFGAYPCYVALSPDRSQLAVANYGTGNIAVYEVDEHTGALNGEAQVRQHSGAGPNQQRQEGPHAHWVQWDPQGEFVYVVDLGIDEVKGYPVDPETGELGEGFTALATEVGAGPRHMVFHPDGERVYVLNELANSVTVAAREADGRLRPLNTLTTLPEGFNGHSQAAHIAISPDGGQLYASNRGHHSIAVFTIDGAGDLELLQWVRAGGEWPRHFSLTDVADALVTANEHSHNLVAFAVGDNGRLIPTGESVTVAKPVFVAPFAF